MRRTNLFLLPLACVILMNISSCDTSQEIQLQQSDYTAYPEKGVEVVAIRDDQNIVTGYYYSDAPDDVFPKLRTEGYRITNRSDVIRHLVSDIDNFGFGGNGIPPCIFYDMSDPIIDLGIFDKELGFANEVQTWTHDFTQDPYYCEGARIDSVIVEIREYFSQDQSSTINIDGFTMMFTPDPSFCNAPVIRSFLFVGEAASFASDGVINITFSENGDDVALDWSAVYVVVNCEPVIIVDTDNDGTPDDEDNCPAQSNPAQDDNDSDGEGDLCDEDDDNDGVTDDDDNCPTDSNNSQNDLDADGEGDACDADDDNDGIADGIDNCPVVPNIGQDDYDSDGAGNACDVDDDNDGVNDSNDVHPYSNVDATVNFNSCNSGVENQLLSGGTTMMDMIMECAANSSNKGKFRSCVTQLTNDWKAEGLITTEERDSIKSCL